MFVTQIQTKKNTQKTRKMEAVRRALANQAQLRLSEQTLIECRRQTADLAVEFDGLPPPIPRTQQQLFKRLMDPADYEQYKQEMIAECAEDNSDSDWHSREDEKRKKSA